MNKVRQRSRGNWLAGGFVSVLAAAIDLIRRNRRGATATITIHSPDGDEIVISNFEATPERLNELAVTLTEAAPARTESGEAHVEG